MEKLNKYIGFKRDIESKNKYLKLYYFDIDTNIKP
jgi:hypothetical protein